VQKSVRVVTLRVTRQVSTHETATAHTGGRCAKLQKDSAAMI